MAKVQIADYYSKETQKNPGEATIFPMYLCAEIIPVYEALTNSGHKVKIYSTNNCFSHFKVYKKKETFKKVKAWFQRIGFEVHGPWQSKKDLARGNVVNFIQEIEIEHSTCWEFEE